MKTNLGHLEAAAGIAGFIKAVLTVQRGFIPRHLNFRQLTTYASEAASRLNIASEGLEWSHCFGWVGTERRWWPSPTGSDTLMIPRPPTRTRPLPRC
ncbi:hypothetical protein ACN3XK_74965 [Actinomadura welshii]